ncbi:MAG: universal stress protein [Candidatus Melainabacteria bacterium]|nr:universal stress protein [Candidatus Melainabacteria bacterium]
MTFGKILVALDGSASGQIAVDYAFWLADKLDASLTAQHVVDERLVQYFVDPEFGKALGLNSVQETEKRVFNALRKIGNTVLQLFREEAVQRAMDVSTALDEGRVVERILQYSSKFDLLVIGHHGKDDTKLSDPMPLGSVAERVVLGAHIPVLIALKPLTQIQQVIVAYDGSEAARGALLMSENFAKRIGAKLTEIFSNVVF